MSGKGEIVRERNKRCFYIFFSKKIKSLSISSANITLWRIVERVACAGCLNLSACFLGVSVRRVRRVRRVKRASMSKPVHSAIKLFYRRYMVRLRAQIGYKRRYMKGGNLGSIAGNILDRKFSPDMPNQAW